MADRLFKIKNKHLAYLAQTGLSWDRIEEISTKPHEPIIDKSDNPLVDVLRLIRNPRHFHFTCKYILGIDLPPFQNLILQEMWNSPFPMLIGSRGASKSTMLAIYALLRAVLCQGCKVALVGAVFRQSKVIFENCERIWNNAPILREMSKGTGDTRFGVSRGNDQWTLFVGESTISAYPLGTGEKIRGQRAHYLIVDEFATINKEIYENVIQGFSAVSANPVVSMKRDAEIDLLKELGVWGESQDETDRTNYKGNQRILAGTAYYAFNHFYEYWQRYKNSINSRGDQEKLKREHGFSLPEGVSHKDYKVFRLPVELLPRGFMSTKSIADSKLNLSQTNYLLEFSACLSPETLVITDVGAKPIVDIREGDMVLTHKGRFRPVTHCMAKPFNKDIVRAKAYSYNQDIFITPNHMVLQDNESWKPIGEKNTNLYLANLKELSGKTSIDIRDYVENYSQVENLIYPNGARLTVDPSIVQYIRSRPESVRNVDIARELDMNYGKVQQIRHNIKVPKNAMPCQIKLDYDFGMIMGYYLSEGSCSKGFVHFALDGHVDAELQSFVTDLVGALERVFGFKPKVYDKKDNTVSVVMCSRLIRDLIKNICPGICYDKFIHPDILFSNKDFMRGFIVGYWNGDGHKKIETYVTTANTSSLAIATQVKLVLSYFDIVGCIQKKGESTSRIKGKIYNTKEFYRIDLFSSESIKFRREFFANELRIDVVQNYARKIYNDGENAVARIYEKELVPYDGYVYNLEVAEDHSYSLMNATVHNCFCADSAGFFRRLLVEHCTTNKPIPTPDGDVQFRTVLRGDPTKKYIYGIDPASEQDNFSIVILECHPNHSRIVHCWVTNDKKHKTLLRLGRVKNHDFYRYAARKIRDLMKDFPCQHIALDAQGGGKHIAEALADPDNLEDGEQLIYPVTSEHPLYDGIERESDNKPGLHILELVQMVRAEYTADANHGMKKDFETQQLLFPLFDAVELGLAAQQDSMMGNDWDTLEEVVQDIEELKDELALIQHTQTANGRERWDTPEQKLEGDKKGRMRKDRYSALLMANAAARRMRQYSPQKMSMPAGRFAHQFSKPSTGKMYEGPSWWTSQVSNSYGVGVNRRR